MKDIVTPVPPEEVRVMIKKSLETAALVNYTRLSGEAKIEGKICRFHPLENTASFTQSCLIALIV